MASKARNSASARLLAKVMESGSHTPAALGAALGVSASRVTEYAGQHATMPLALQYRLALWVEAELPHLGRQARALRAQVVAQASWQSSTTVCHPHPPQRW
jgi:hypothetical protein